MRKRTIRKLPPLAKELAKFQNELGSMKRRMDRLIRLAVESEKARQAVETVMNQGPGTPLAKTGLKRRLKAE